MKTVDLRSDTVTRPTKEMFDAILKADLGDDVLGDEPTVQKLERLAAEMAGKEAAVYVPSGTMGNQIAICCHTQPGDVIIAEEEAHILYYEVGAPAILANVITRNVPSIRGILDPDEVEKRVMQRSLHTPGSTLLCIENTHNRAGGTITSIERMKELNAVARKHGMKVHLDGARVFNAAVALGVPLTSIISHVDSVSMCLSKGLRSPVGSVLCGPTEFIERARIWRKRLGGGMRQAGILAACGIVSLTKMVDRLAEDHKRCRTLFAALKDLPGLTIDPETVQTNILIVQSQRPAVEWVKALGEKGVDFFPFGEYRFRLVLHADVDDAQVERAIGAFKLTAEHFAKSPAAV
ncbi:MAG: aminotransferase class I/II-fold pyridoxal phosphate-dependent enzyme [Armatimonadetes bacterium]|nr:aminotransferase class I/II-fold pyridoxal phosphate-dependent enzyme [Armatimonadota bacterium]